MKRQKRQQYLGLLLLIALIVLVGSYIFWQRQKAPAVVVTKVNHPGTTTPAKSAAFDKTQLSLTDPTSLWVIVNKHRPLPNGYIPTGLTAPDVPLRLSAGTEEMKMRPDSGIALKELVADAKTAGLNLLLASGYRSQVSQKTLHDSYVTQSGAAAADASSARAGFSEHQTGLAVDVGRADHKCEVDACFADTAEGQWVAANAYKYGFVIRYPQSKQSITGYVYEPWHLRYVGKDLAQAVQDSGGQTLEEFFSIAPAPDYQ